MPNPFDVGTCWEENERPDGIYRVTADDADPQNRQITLELVQPHLEGILDAEIHVPALTLLGRWHQLECPAAPR